MVIFEDVEESGRLYLNTTLNSQAMQEGVKQTTNIERLVHRSRRTRPPLLRTRSPMLLCSTMKAADCGGCSSIELKYGGCSTVAFNCFSSNATCCSTVDELGCCLSSEDAPL